MNVPLIAAAIGVLGAALAVTEVPAAVAADLAAGVATADITPPVGYRMAGYFSERLSTGILDPLRAKALVLRQGDQRAALVFCDLIGVPVEVSSQARRQAAEKTGIPASNILIAATHSHTGPLYFDALRKHLHDLAVTQRGSDPREAVDYGATLVARIVQVIAEAHAAARPAALAVAEAEAPPLAFNRRFHMKDGSVRFNPGPLNPDIVRPAGPTDPQVRAIFVRRPDAPQPVAAVVNFALHLDTTGGTQFSADYPFYVEQSLRETFGRDFTLLFATGACGDVNHIDVTRKDRPKPAEIGSRLASAVSGAAAKAVATPALAVRSEVVRVPLQRYTPQELAAAREEIRKVGTAQLPFLRAVEAYRILSLDLRGGEAAPLEVQAFRLSKDVAVVGLPGEVFVELGLAIRKASPFPTTLVVELCNDSPEYVPTKKAFGEGSYEVANSRIAPGGGEMLVEAAVRLLKELAPSSGP